jgi:hypothetical protein
MSDMNGMTIQRDSNGRLLPGSRLNPGGRPRATIEDIRERLLPYMAESVETLVELMRSPNGHLRLAAIREYYDRIAGKAPTAVDTTVTNDIGANIGALYLQALKVANQSQSETAIDVTPGGEQADRIEVPPNEW